MSNPMETVSTNPCPHCLTAGKVSYLRNRQGAFFAYCEGETHKFPDSDELSQLVNQAKQKYPEHFPQKKVPSNTPPKILSFFTVDPENKTAIEAIIGGPINGASELKSIIFGLKNEVAELTEQAQTAKALGVAAGLKAGLKPGEVSLPQDRVFFVIEEYLLETIKEHAAYEEKSVQEYLQEQFHTFIEAYYSPMPQQQAQTG